MGKLIFIGLFIITFLAGAFAYYAPHQKPLDPLKFVMDTSGLNSVLVDNQRRTSSVNMITNNGLLHVHKWMDALAMQQDRFINSLQNQQILLGDSNKQTEDIVLTAVEHGTNNNDLLKIKALTAEMQDEQRLMIEHGQQLLVLNDQLAKSRQMIADQMDAAGLNSQTSQRALQERYAMLQDQAAEFFDKVSQHNQEVSSQMGRMQDQINSLANASISSSALQQQNSKEQIQAMMDREREDMQRIADSEQKNMDLLKDAQQNVQDAKVALNDAVARNRDLVEEQRQKIQDQQWANQQRAQDQKQRIEDQQNR